MNDEQIRKDFEEWLGDGGLSPRAIGRNSMGDYILMQTAHAWEVWKAAHTHYAKSAAPVAMPEPVAAQVRFKPENDTTWSRWKVCAVGDAREIEAYTLANGWGYEVRYLYPEQQVHEVLATSEQPQADTQAAAFEAVRKKLCKLQRYSFWLDEHGGVRRVDDRCGNWIEFDAAHELFDPVAIDAAIAASKEKP